jgi:N-acetylneuraminic acid mutarotase
MSRSVALLLVLVFLTSSLIVAAKPISAATPVENSWTSKAPMHVARSDLGVAVVNGKIYAIGGYPDCKTNEEYDPTTDTWTLKAPMPTPRIHFAIAVYQNKIYCMGGQDSEQDFTRVNEVYDPATNTWTNKTSMPTERLLGPANVVDGKIYLIGGLPNGTLNEEYDPATDTWITKAPMPTAAADTSGVLDDKIYFAGGTFDNYVASSWTQIYDPNTDTWSQGSPPPTFFLVGAAGVTTGVMAPKRIYVFNSPYSNDPLYTNQVYNPEEDSWVTGAAIPTWRSGFAVAVVNDLLYVIGGYTQTYNEFPEDWIHGPELTRYAINEQYTPFGYGTIPPAVAIVSPENMTYTSGNVSLIFTVNKPASWISYSIDGEENVTINGNTTIAGLTSGLHNVTVYAKDEFENTGASETINFIIAEEPEPSPATLVAVTSAVTVTAVGISLMVYLRKRHHKT